uniref:Response regulator receiver protein n=1 Tax=Caulobacter sp. (strain K31) TaxID=366602 RepID=B0SVW8_CAUSK
MGLGLSIRRAIVVVNGGRTWHEPSPGGGSRFQFTLGVSPRTVEVHRADLMSKLQVKSLSEALRITFAAGLQGEI